MGVYIKDMEMPGSCSECDFLSVEKILLGDYVCECAREMPVDNEIVMEGRPDWCQLEEVPSADVPDTNVGEWIPCSEKLPEEDGAYLVTNSRWGAPLLEIVYWITDGFQSKHKPIAWMPLPEPWKGADDD